MPGVCADKKAVSLVNGSAAGKSSKFPFQTLNYLMPKRGPGTDINRVTYLHVRLNHQAIITTRNGHIFWIHNFISLLSGQNLRMENTISTEKLFSYLLPSLFKSVWPTLKTFLFREKTARASTLKSLSDST